MRTLEELMNRHYLVGSFPGHAVFWNHAATFNVYAIDDAGRAEPVDTYTRYCPEGTSEVNKIKWAITAGREIAAELKDNDEKAIRN